MWRSSGSSATAAGSTSGSTDYSWQYNWEYVYLPDVDSPPPTRFPGEEWTHIRGDWWFHRAHDD